MIAYIQSTGSFKENNDSSALMVNPDVDQSIHSDNYLVEMLISTRLVSHSPSQKRKVPINTAGRPRWEI